jgi:hypothetical protein
VQSCCTWLTVCWQLGPIRTGACMGILLAIKLPNIMVITIIMASRPITTMKLPLRQKTEILSRLTMIPTTVPLAATWLRQPLIRLSWSSLQPLKRSFRSAYL